MAISAIALGTALDTALALGNTVKTREFLAVFDSLQPGELTPLLKAQQARRAVQVVHFLEP